MIKFPHFRKRDIVEFAQSQYCVQLNDRFECFPTKSAMKKFIEDYSQKNVIYSLSMFRCDYFNLIK